MSASLDDAVVALAKQVTRLGHEVEALRTELDEHKVAFNSFRGRVYAWKKWTADEKDPAKPSQEPGELPLSDPRVPISQVRARLLKPGKPFPHN